jgi:hypothetical protein
MLLVVFVAALCPALLCLLRLLVAGDQEAVYACGVMLCGRGVPVLWCYQLAVLHVGGREQPAMLYVGMS